MTAPSDPSGSVTTPDLVLLDVDAGADKEAVIGRLATTLAGAGRSTDAAGLTAAAMTREGQSATGLPGLQAVRCARILEGQVLDVLREQRHARRFLGCAFAVGAVGGLGHLVCSLKSVGQAASWTRRIVSWGTVVLHKAARQPQAEGPRRHPVARGVRPAGGRLVPAIGHHLVQAEPDARVGHRPPHQGARVPVPAGEVGAVLLQLRRRARARRGRRACPTARQSPAQAHRGLRGRRVALRGAGRPRRPTPALRATRRRGLSCACHRKAQSRGHSDTRRRSWSPRTAMPAAGQRLLRANRRRPAPSCPPEPPGAAAG